MRAWLHGDCVLAGGASAGQLECPCNMLPSSTALLLLLVNGHSTAHYAQHSTARCAQHAAHRHLQHACMHLHTHVDVHVAMARITSAPASTPVPAPHGVSGAICSATVTCRDPRYCRRVPHTPAGFKSGPTSAQLACNALDLVCAGRGHSRPAAMGACRQQASWPLGGSVQDVGMCTVLRGCAAAGGLLHSCMQQSGRQPEVLPGLAGYSAAHITMPGPVSKVHPGPGGLRPERLPACLCAGQPDCTRYTHACTTCICCAAVQCASRSHRAACRRLG